MGESAQDLLASLCADLNLLWRQAGGPSLRALEPRLRMGKSQLGAILNGRVRRPPDWRVVGGLVRCIHEYAASQGRLDRLSLRTGVDAYWRPRYALLEHAFSQPRSAATTNAANGTGVHLLEREAALASLTRYATEAGRGEGRLALVAGEAGVGKSALVERLRRDLPGARWSWGACDGLFTPRPLGPLFDLADQLGGALVDRYRAGADREELFRALHARINGGAVLDVVVIEDVHWADEATLDLLRFLARRLRDAAVLLIVTYRDEGIEADDALRVTLGDLATQRVTRRIVLAPLSVDAVRVLADGTALDPAALHRLTGGNPFYTTEVLRAGTVQVPASAHDAILGRMARVSSRARSVLEVAALIGGRVELRLLESAVACPPSAVDELLSGGWLVGDPAGLRFRHEIARLAVEQAIRPHRGRGVHRRILDALRRFGCDDDARMAYHAEAAGDGPAVLRHASAAARRAAALGSHREAAAQFQRALRFAAGAETAAIAELYDGLADEMALVDRIHDALDAAEHALVRWRELGDRLREGRGQRRLARINGSLCRRDSARAAAESAIAILEPLGPSVELAWAYATAAHQAMMNSDYEPAMSWAERAQAIAERVGAIDVRSDALNTLAVSIGVRGGDWTGPMHQALELALSADLPEQAARAFSNLCGLHGDKREFATAEPLLAEGIGYCDERDLACDANFLRGELANVLAETGRWAAAADLSAKLLTETGSSPGNRLCTLRRLGIVRARSGRPGVWDCLDEAALAADSSGQPQQVVPVRLARAEAYWLEGRVEEARREAQLADDMCAQRHEWERGAVAVWLRWTGSARPARGPVAEPYRLLLGGDWRGAADAWTALGCPYDAALALATAPAAAAQREALGILTGLGAAPAARLVRQRLRANAAATTGPDATGPDATGPDATGPDATGPDATFSGVPRTRC